jgi:tetratricopeptide (TPR) repeat protein
MSLGFVAFMQGNSVVARSWYEEALTLAREMGDKAAAAFALRNLEDAHYRAGDLAAARAAFTESLATFREVGDSWGTAITLGALVTLALVQGDAATARSLSEESLPLSRQVGNTWSLALVLVNLGAAVLQEGDHQQARDHFVEGLRLWRELGNQTGSMMAVAGLAEVAALQGQAERAGRLFGAADALFPVGGLLLDGSDRTAFDRRVAAARGPPRRGRVRGWMGSRAGHDAGAGHRRGVGRDPVLDPVAHTRCGTGRRRLAHATMTPAAPRSTRPFLTRLFAQRT